MKDRIQGIGDPLVMTSQKGADTLIKIKGAVGKRSGGRASARPYAKMRCRRDTILGVR